MDPFQRFSQQGTNHLEFFPNLVAPNAGRTIVGHQVLQATLNVGLVQVPPPAARNILVNPVVQYNFWPQIPAPIQGNMQYPVGQMLLPSENPGPLYVNQFGLGNGQQWNQYVNHSTLPISLNPELSAASTTARRSPATVPPIPSPRAPRIPESVSSRDFSAALTTSRRSPETAPSTPSPLAPRTPSTSPPAPLPLAPRTPSTAPPTPSPRAPRSPASETSAATSPTESPSTPANLESDCLISALSIEDVNMEEVNLMRCKVCCADVEVMELGTHTFSHYFDRRYCYCSLCEQTVKRCLFNGHNRRHMKMTEEICRHGKGRKCLQGDLIQCNVCYKVMSTNSLRYHVLQKHMEALELLNQKNSQIEVNIREKFGMNREYFCRECGRNVDLKECMIPTCQSVYICDCGFRTLEYESKNQHLLTHHAKFKCLVCGFIFDTPDNLERHARDHYDMHPE